MGQVTQEYDETVPKGNVLSQEPAAQTEVTRKSEVAFVVSKGPEPTLPPEPTTPPEQAPLPPSDTGAAGGSGTDTTPSDSSGTHNPAPDTGTMTDTSGASATQGLSDGGAPENKDRTFDVTTKIEPGSGKSRIRVIVTDDHGRNEQINELYRRGQTIQTWSKLGGRPARSGSRCTRTANSSSTGGTDLWQHDWRRPSWPVTSPYSERRSSAVGGPGPIGCTWI